MTNKLFNYIFILFLTLLPLNGRVNVFDGVSVNLVFIGVLMLFFIIRILQNRKITFAFDKKISLLIVVFFILNIASFFVIDITKSQALSLYFNELRAFIVPIFILFFTISYLKNEIMLDHLMKALFIGGFIISVVTIIQMIIIIQTLGYKGTGVLGNPNYFAGIIAILLPIAFHNVFNDKSNLLKNVMYMVYYLAILISFSKTAWAIAAFSFLIFHIKFKKKNILFFILFILIVWQAINIVETNLDINRILNDTLEGFGGSTRVELAKVSYEMIKDHFVFGVGLGNYRIATFDYSGIYDKYSPGYVAHNIIFDVFAETGIFTFIIFILLIIRSFANLATRKVNKYDEKLLKTLSMSFIFVLLYTLTHGSGRTFYYLWILIAISMKIPYLTGEGE